MPMIHEMMPPKMQPATAVFGPFAEKTRAWKSRAAREGGVRWEGCGGDVGRDPNARLEVEGGEVVREGGVR